MRKAQHRQNVQLRRERARLRCNLIACPAPAASPANAAKAAVHIRPLAGGEVAVLRESSRQRLQKLQQVYAQQGAEAFNEVARKEAERLESKTVVFILASARIRAYLRRKRLLEKSGLSLNYTGDIGISRKGKYDDSDDFVRVFEFVFETAKRAPPSENSLRLCQISLLTPSSVWLGFVSPRALRAPTRAARCERVAWVK